MATIGWECRAPMSNDCLQAIMCRLNAEEIKFALCILLANVSQKAQQVVVQGIERIDAFMNGRIYELKNYNWSKYSLSKLQQVIQNFVSQT